MAIEDYKILPADIQAVHVEAQPTVLTGSAQDNKKVFDKYSDMIVEHFNDLIDELADNTSELIDQDVLTLYAALGWVE